MTLFCHQLLILLWIVTVLSFSLGAEPNTLTPGTHSSHGPTDTSMTPEDRSTTLLSTKTPVSTEPSSTDRATTTTQDPSTVLTSTDGTSPTTAAISKTEEVSTTADLTSTSDTTETTGAVGTTATETRTISSISTAERTSSHKTSAYTVTSPESMEKDSQSTDSGMTTPTATPALSRGVSPSTTEHAGTSSSVTTETGRTSAESNTTPDIVPTSSTKEPGTHKTTAINTATTDTGTKDSKTTGTGITKYTIPPNGQTSLPVTEGSTLSSTRPAATTKGPETSLPVTEGSTLSSTRPAATTKGPETSLPVTEGSTLSSTRSTATTKGPETFLPVTDGATSSTPSATITGSPHTDKTTGTEGTTNSTTTAGTPALPPTSSSSSSPPSPGSTQTPGSSTDAPIDTSTTTPAPSPTITPTGETPGQPTSKTSESPLPPFHTSTYPTGGSTTQPESAITAATSLPPPIHILCPSTPCPYDSICLSGTCQCVSGTFLLEGSCVQAQVFSGDLHLNQTFQDEMSNRSSVIFQQTAARISEALRRALEKESGYTQTDVVLLRQGSVIATVNNVFKLGSSASQTSTNGAIEKAIQDCGMTCGTILERATFTATDLCDQTPLPCDVHSTTCEYKQDGVTRCFCKAGYINSFYSNQSCTACPSGQRSEGDTCVPCPFGYAGFNCTDSALLAVVVIACVLGGVLLIMLLALFAYCCWNRSQSVKKPSAEFSSPYPVEDFRGPWSTTQGITPIPRASTNWASAPMEMIEGGSTHTLVDMKPYTNGATGSYDLTSDSMNTFKGKNQSRYSYLVQGHENPYFIPADERRPV